MRAALSASNLVKTRARGRIRSHAPSSGVRTQIGSHMPSSRVRTHRVGFPLPPFLSQLILVVPLSLVFTLPSPPARPPPSFPFFLLPSFSPLPPSILSHSFLPVSPCPSLILSLPSPALPVLQYNHSARLRIRIPPLQEVHVCVSRQSPLLCSD